MRPNKAKPKGSRSETRPTGPKAGEDFEAIAQRVKDLKLDIGPPLHSSGSQIGGSPRDRLAAQLLARMDVRWRELYNRSIADSLAFAGDLRGLLRAWLNGD